MPRPSQIAQQRRRLLPRVADAFADLGYRRATTAELARRCGVRENILYRLWPSKKAMYLAAVEEVFARSQTLWRAQVADASKKPGRSTRERLLDYESTHHGEFGLYRIVFDGLSEVDDPDVRRALVRMYRHFHRFIVAQLEARTTDGGRGRGPRAVTRAWALIGLGTVANIGRSLGVISPAERRRLFVEVGRLLLHE